MILLTTSAISTIILFCHQFIYNIIGEGCNSAYHRLRNVHVPNNTRERTPQKYLDFMLQRVIFASTTRVTLHAAKILV